MFPPPPLIFAFSSMEGTDQKEISMDMSGAGYSTYPHSADNKLAEPNYEVICKDVKAKHDYTKDYSCLQHSSPPAVPNNDLGDPVYQELDNHVYHVLNGQPLCYESPKKRVSPLSSSAIPNIPSYTLLPENTPNNDTVTTTPTSGAPHLCQPIMTGMLKNSDSDIRYALELTPIDKDSKKQEKQSGDCNSKESGTFPTNSDTSGLNSGLPSSHNSDGNVAQVSSETIVDGKLTMGREKGSKQMSQAIRSSSVLLPWNSRKLQARAEKASLANGPRPSSVVDGFTDEWLAWTTEHSQHWKTM